MSFTDLFESGAHSTYKKALINSKSDDTVLTICMNKGWENATHRMLRNSTFKMWESDGFSSVGQRPGEFDIVGKNSSGRTIERYSFSAPTIGVTGNIEAMVLYAGKSIDSINDIKSASNIINDIWSEYLINL